MPEEALALASRAHLNTETPLEPDERIEHVFRRPVPVDRSFPVRKPVTGEVSTRFMQFFASGVNERAREQDVAFGGASV
jgi:hypothetical protein